MLPKANYDDFCVWNRSTSDKHPTLAEYRKLTVGELQTIKSEADRIRANVDVDISPKN